MKPTAHPLPRWPSVPSQVCHLGSNLTLPLDPFANHYATSMPPKPPPSPKSSTGHSHPREAFSDTGFRLSRNLASTAVSSHSEPPASGAQSASLLPQPVSPEGTGTLPVLFAASGHVGAQ